MNNRSEAPDSGFNMLVPQVLLPHLLRFYRSISSALMRLRNLPTDGRLVTLQSLNPKPFNHQGFKVVKTSTDAAFPCLARSGR